MSGSDTEIPTKRTSGFQRKNKKQTRRLDFIPRDAGHENLMQVITLDPDGLQSHAARLATKVRHSHSAPFDAIVGIRCGGTHVCDALCRYMPKESFHTRFDINLQRPSTKKKTETIGKILIRLPRPILNIMRMAESKILEFSRRISSKRDQRHIAVPRDLTEMLKSIDSPEILIVDDAVDSGVTLKTVSDTLQGINPRTKITSAVITRTTSHPVFSPDFSLYADNTLIRFPWSKDYHR